MPTSLTKKRTLSVIIVITILFMVTSRLFFNYSPFGDIDLEDMSLPVPKDKPLMIWSTDFNDDIDLEEVSLPVFKVKPLVIWSSDLHIGPIHDFKNFLKPMGVRIIDKTLDHTRCHRTQNCEGMKTLKIINPHNIMNLNYSLIPKFYNAYVNDTELASVDAFACFHSSALCELYAPFNKSLIIVATHRYELGRFGKERWTKWNKNLVQYASMPWNVVAANNLYDVEYIKYFTGIQPLLLPSFCNHHNVTYKPTRKGFLFAHNSNTDFFDRALRQFYKACKATRCKVYATPLKEKYENYKFSDIAAHYGIIHIPYQVSVMSFFEQYRMNMPLFAPSKALLIEWELKHTALRERTWSGAYGPRPNGSAIEPHPSQRYVPDPNTYSEPTVRYWLNFCDYYRLPYVMYYDSMRHLVQILEMITSEQLLEISEKMKLFNIREEKKLRLKWKNILLKIAKHSSNNPH